MRVLFITRNYPPMVGGMQQFAWDFYHNYRKVGQIDLLANPGGKSTIIPFVIRAIGFIVRHGRKYDVIHLYDAALSPLLLLVRLLSRAKVSLTVNGLDVVYPNPVYQLLIRFFLKRADRVVAISRYTMEQCAVRGIPPEKLPVISLGIDPEAAVGSRAVADPRLLAKYQPYMEGKKALLTVGRLVKRKGHAWFISHVLPRLPQEYIYLVAGSGPEEGSIRQLVNELGVQDRVYLLGNVSDDEKAWLYRLAHLFVMPNIPVPGDQEGFGIVLLEAGLNGLPLVASGIEGITDAVIEGKTGCLVPAEDVNAFVEAILHPGLDRTAIVDAVVDRFAWSKIIDQYQREFAQMSAPRVGE